MNGQTVGYARVSTVEQNEQRQIESLTAAGCDKIFIDKVSGKNTERPQLKAMLDYIRDNDTVIVSEYSRLARNARDLLNLVREIESKGATMKSLKENFDTSTPAGRLMVTMLAGISEFERDMILQRQREGIAIAKAQGKYEGRKEVEPPENWFEIKADYLSRNTTVTEIAKTYGVSRPTVYKWIKSC